MKKQVLVYYLVTQDGSENLGFMSVNKGQDPMKLAHEWLVAIHNEEIADDTRDGDEETDEATATDITTENSPIVDLVKNTDPQRKSFFLSGKAQSPGEGEGHFVDLITEVDRSFLKKPKRGAKVKAAYKPSELEIVGWQKYTEEGGWFHCLEFQTPKGGRVLIGDDTDAVEVWSTDESFTVKDAADCWSFWHMGGSDFPAKSGIDFSKIRKIEHRHLEGGKLIFENSGVELSKL